MRLPEPAVSYDAPYCVEQDSEQSAYVHLSHATQLGLFFRFLTYPHNPSPDSYCQGLGKGGKKERGAEESGKKQRQNHLGPWTKEKGTQCSGCLQDDTWGRESEQENRLGTNTQEGEWKSLNDKTGDNSRQDSVLFWMIQVLRFRRNFGHLNLAGSYTLLLFFPSPIHISSAIKWKKQVLDSLTFGCT